MRQAKNIFIKHLLLLIGAAPLLVSSPAAAQSTPICEGFAPEEQLRIYHETIFAEELTFHLCWHNEPNLVEATISIDGDDIPTPIEGIVNAPEGAQTGDLINLNYPLDLGTQLISPFSNIAYTWTLHFADSAPEEQATREIFYRDDSIEWVTTPSADGMIFVHTTADDEAIADTAIGILEESRPEILQYLPTEPIQFNHVDVYLYPSSEAFLTTLRLTGLDWIVGKASPEVGVLMVPISNRNDIKGDLRQRLPHELAHLLLYRAAGDGYERFPAWLDEGFATQFERPVNSNYQTSLANVNNSTQLIPFRELCVNLPVQPPEISMRGYAQSHEVVKYLLDQELNERGQNAIEAVLEQTKAGVPCEEAVLNALGRSGDEIAEEWIGRNQPQFPDPRSPVWIAIAVLVGLFIFITLVLWSRTDNTRTLGDFNR